MRDEKNAFWNTIRMSKGEYMKNQMKKSCFLLLVCVLCMLPAMPVKAVGAGSNQLTLVKGQTYQLPNASWFCKYYAADAKIVEVSESGELTAKRVGETLVSQTTLQGVIQYRVMVTDAVDVVVMMGQSNMVGSGGNVFESPDVNAMALQYSKGKLRNLSRQGTLIPAFANAYIKQTKTPLISIQTAVGGTSSSGWVGRGYTKDAQKELKSCLSYLKNKKVTVKHVYCLWLQGETDAQQGVTKDGYIANVRTIASRMKKAGSEKFLIIQVGRYRDNNIYMGDIVAAQKQLCKNYKKQFAMATTVTNTISNSKAYYADSVHFNQKALNKIGSSAGKFAGKLAKQTKK